MTETDFLLMVGGALFAMIVNWIGNYKKSAWIGLTKEEIDYLIKSTPYEDDHLLVEKTEALLKEKNT